MKKLYAILLALCLTLGLASVATALPLDVTGKLTIAGSYTGGVWSWGATDSSKYFADLKFSKTFGDVSKAWLTIKVAQKTILAYDFNGNGIYEPLMGDYKDTYLVFTFDDWGYSYFVNDDLTVSAVKKATAYEGPIFGDFLGYAIKTSDGALKVDYSLGDASLVAYTNAQAPFSGAIGGTFDAGDLTVGAGASFDAGQTVVGAFATCQVMDELAVTAEVSYDPAFVGLGYGVQIAYDDDIFGVTAQYLYDQTWAAPFTNGRDRLDIDVSVVAVPDLLDLSAWYGTFVTVTPFVAFEYGVRADVAITETLTGFAQYEFYNDWRWELNDDFFYEAATFGLAWKLDGTNTLKAEYNYYIWGAANSLDLELVIAF